MVGATAECTEFAADETDIGEVDVAGDDVSNHVPGERATQLVSRDEQAEQVVAFALGQQQTFLMTKRVAVARVQYFRQCASYLRREPGRNGVVPERSPLEESFRAEIGVHGISGINPVFADG